jgi:hypothetical protein
MNYSAMLLVFILTILSILLIAFPFKLNHYLLIVD